MGLMNESGIVYAITNGLTSDVTGTVFLTLLLIVIGFMFFAFAFRIPLEVTALIIFPMLVAMVVEGGISFFPVLGVAMIYLSVLLAKNFFFWKG